MLPDLFFIYAQGKLHVIKEIGGDGTVKLKQLDKDGSEEGKLIKAAYDVFIAKYQVAATATKAEVFIAYPDLDIAKNIRFELIHEQTLITKALIDFYENCKLPLVKVRAKPQKAIVAATTFAKHELVIPIFGKVAWMKKDEDLPDRAYEVKGHSMKAYSFFIKVQSYSADEEEFGVAVTPAAFVQYTSKEEDITAAVTWKQLPKKNKADFKIPVIWNTVGLSKSEEVKLMAPEKANKLHICISI